MTTHQFGGDWTEQKLGALSKYLKAYRTIFDKNPYARYFTTNYVDAFAGTGYRKLSTPTSFEDVDEEALQYQKGSAVIALEIDPPFHRFVFIDRKDDHIKELAKLRDPYPDREIELITGDANKSLDDWCRKMNWKKNRAVVFLDPYGMEVNWSTIKTIAETKAIDLWVLIPLGQAINRVLTRHGPPEGPWAERLTAFFGTEEWRDEFYRPRAQPLLPMFDGPQLEKEAPLEKIGEFCVKRLQSVFFRVAQNPLYLRNSKNVPIYLLCFAASNERGAPTAVKIAQDILGK